MGRQGSLALLTTLALGVGQAQGQPTAVAPWALNLLTPYEQANYTEVESQVRAILNLRRFREEFPAEAEEWIDLVEPAQRDRRRAIAATAALEVANQGGAGQWREGKLLLEWACTLVRRNDLRGNAERLWHWAAISLLSAAANADALDTHVEHARARFPDEPRFVLAQAVAAELRTWPDSRDGSSISGRDRELVTRRLEAALKYDSIRAEAELRLAYVSLRLNRPEDALRHVMKVVPSTRDHHLKYLAYLFQGRALERMHRMGEAVEAYRAAVALAPRAQTAQLALAIALSRNNERGDAERVGLAAVTSEPGYDPWLDYGDGDSRLWQPILQALRQALK